jgi:hypothetical protein
VLSSCCVAFAHGSNDVANSIGPFSAIYTTYRTHAVPSSKTTTPKWIFAMGGSLIVVGLITYGAQGIGQREFEGRPRTRASFSPRLCTPVAAVPCTLNPPLHLLCAPPLHTQATTSS